jgi:hypothetical protein
MGCIWSAKPFPAILCYMVNILQHRINSQYAFAVAFHVRSSWFLPEPFRWPGLRDHSAMKHEPLYCLPQRETVLSWPLCLWVYRFQPVQPVLFSFAAQSTTGTASSVISLADTASVSGSSNSTVSSVILSSECPGRHLEIFLQYSGKIKFPLLCRQNRFRIRQNQLFNSIKRPIDLRSG